MSTNQTTDQENAFWVTVESFHRFYLPTAIVQYRGIRRGDKLKIKIVEIQRDEDKKSKEGKKSDRRRRN
jgi:hypothetical protein